MRVSDARLNAINECQRMIDVKLSRVPVHGVVSSFEPDASGPAEELLLERGGVLHRLLDSLLELLPDSRDAEEVGRLRLLQRRNQRALLTHTHNMYTTCCCKQYSIQLNKGI